jgi:hypothetical protein
MPKELGMTSERIAPVSVYVFLVKRAVDKKSWPCVYTDRDLAEKAVGRISPVAQITFRDDGGRGWRREWVNLDASE